MLLEGVGVEIGLGVRCAGEGEGRVEERAGYYRTGEMTDSRLRGRRGKVESREVC